MATFAATTPSPTMSEIPTTTNEDVNDDRKPTIEDEEDMTPAERMEFLRLHGVEVVERASDKTAASAATKKPTLSSSSPLLSNYKSVKYIMIPCNGALPPRTLYLQEPLDSDSSPGPGSSSSRNPSGTGYFADPLLTELKGKFNLSSHKAFQSKYTPAEMMRMNESSNPTSLLSGGGLPTATPITAPSDATINSLVTQDELTGETTVETFPLSTAGPTNEFKQLNIYLDECSALKVSERSEAKRASFEEDEKYIRATTKLN